MSNSKIPGRPVYTPLKRGETRDISYYEAAKRHQDAIQSDVIEKAGRSGKLALELADAAHAHASQFMEQVGSAFETDCKNGCSYCCYQPATVFPFEAIRIAKVLKSTRSEAELAALKEKMRARVSVFAGASVQKNINNKTACPLLVKEQCSVYENRPLTCRMAHSFSVKRCRSAFQKDRTQVQIPISLELQTGIGGIIGGVFERLPGKGLDGNLYELCSAVLTALDEPEAATRWARGDAAVFRECVRDDT